MAIYQLCQTAQSLVLLALLLAMPIGAAVSCPRPVAGVFGHPRPVLSPVDHASEESEKLFNKEWHR